MAKQSGLFNFEGTLDNVTFYKTADGHFVRKKGGVNKKRIFSDAAFIRTRENCAEFSECAKAASTLRRSAAMLVYKAKDSKLSSRLIKLFFAVKKLDSVNFRGARNVGQGLTTLTGKQLLKGFEFNKNARLHALLAAPYDLNVATGTVSIVDLQPVAHLNFPVGSTHFSLQSAVLHLDFVTGNSEIYYSDLLNYPLTMDIENPILEPSALPTLQGTKIYLLLCEFFQEVNGVQYSLNNGLYNALSILEVL